MERTICACDKCRVGCETMPGCLGVGDLDRILEYVGDNSMEFVLTHFAVSLGTKIGIMHDDRMEVQVVPTIVPRQRTNGECCFLEPNGTCGIHAVSPYGCSMLDTHMTLPEAESRVRKMIEDLRADTEEAGEYALVCVFLAANNKVAPPISVRKRRYGLAMDALTEGSPQ